ncbi:hypothetical protein [Deinococcus sp. PEB2-67]
MKLSSWQDSTGRSGYSFRRPGCSGYHSIVTQGPSPWTWNGDLDRPAFSPSVLVTLNYPDRTYVCHSYVGMGGAQPGEIIFLPDSTHALAGQTVPLPDWAPIG